MEGWLYLVRSSRFGLQSSRKRYFVLEENSLHCFKCLPFSRTEDPIKSTLIDSCIRVADNGRESIHRKVLFIFTLYNSSDHSDQLKLGARSSEEAAKWMHSFKEAALKECLNRRENLLVFSRQKHRYFRLSRRRGIGHMNSLVHAEPVTADVVAPYSWEIFGCRNGLRLFKEANGNFRRKNYDDHPAIMAVGMVDATSEAVFQTVMTIGASRSEWDFCVSRATIVEHLDGHTDIIQEQIKKDWLPWGMKPRELLMRRYWRREDDGTYVILFHSVIHKKCSPQKGYVRACLKGGGYVISPLNQGKQSVVKHMLSINWKYWKSSMFKSCEIYLTIRMTERVAALREMFRAKFGSYPCVDCSRGELTRCGASPECDKEDIKVELQSTVENGHTEDPPAEVPEEEPYIKPSNSTTPFLQLSNASDEFFDVPEQSEYEYFDLDSDQFMSECSEDTWFPDAANGKQTQVQERSQQKMSTAAIFVKKLQNLAVQRKIHRDLREVTLEEGLSCSSCLYGSTLPKDPTCSTPCSWTIPDPSTFLIRGKNYLQDWKKVKASGTLMQLVGVDWLKSDRREDDLGGRPSSLVQKYAAGFGSEFFFIINFQIPGSVTYNIALYYMMESPLGRNPLLERFVNGDDAFRNSRFKLIPFISKGSWIVRQTVGRKACLLATGLEINYFRGKNYLEIAVHIGSSSVATGITGLVLRYLNTLVIELAFLIQANTEEELPEFLLGTCQLNHLDIAKAVNARP
ncbi:protein ENHANCED DISEASE RESISTANCE 2-like isoform X2 [Nymphaea colorata]|uniref:protein ENHANCED DISEASE RESISTANCE 2-like isoform X2 n=1 Tax=Nymphaea colorata TaxID=210225 RepID=UPI00129DFE8A|nr:protein ENHANCED DISEASE RESISTANCE 2-like isoform X2 [Nymphaea colorata]